jgi:predicted ABC-type ATPase
VDTRIPLVVLLAGPNGAGKSTSAAQLFQGALAVGEFVNADIADPIAWKRLEEQQQ